MKVTYYGHACFLAEIQRKKILFDPFIANNPLASQIDVNSIKTDYILISHGHNDHISDALTICSNNNSEIISNFEIINWFNNQGIKKVYPLNIGGKIVLDFATFMMVNAVHSSGLPDNIYGGAAAGYVISSNDGNFYFAGDTALTYDMKIIPQFTSLDFAILPIGDNFTMGIEEAIIASDYLKCNKIVGMHYDTFQSIKIDKNNAVNKFRKHGKELILLKIGETINIQKK